LLLARMGRAEAARPRRPSRGRSTRASAGSWTRASRAWVAAGILSMLLGASPRLGVLGEIRAA
jgi:hypothetical protein